jgi:hypothetical protein
MQPEQHEVTVDIKSFISGKTKKYKFVPLKRKEAAEVFHTVLLSVISIIGSSASKDGKDSVQTVMVALRGIDFVTFWLLAEKLLKFVIIDNEEIADINETDYFTDNPEELYLAVFHAVLINYPKVFGKLQGIIRDSIPLKEINDLLNK